jgi:DNA-binding NarL/FixJ family response regulator
MRLKILWVDDSWIVRDRLCNMIATLPTAVVVAQADTEDAARQHLQAHPVELVVIDPELRSGSGFSVISHVKSDHPRVTIVVLTNIVYPEYQARCKGLGAHYFFDKSKETEAFVFQLSCLCAPWPGARYA